MAVIRCDLSSLPKALSRINSFLPSLDGSFLPVPCILESEMPQSVTIVLDTASHQIDVTVEKNSEEEFRDNSMMAVAVQVDSSNKPVGSPIGLGTPSNTVQVNQNKRMYEFNASGLAFNPMTMQLAFPYRIEVAGCVAAVTDISAEEILS